MQIRCNMCGSYFDEKFIVFDVETEEERCPLCHRIGYLQDIQEEDNKKE